MAKKCVKCGYVRKEKEIAPEYECPQCGVIYSKAEKLAANSSVKPITSAAAPIKSTISETPTKTVLSNHPQPYIGATVKQKHVDKAIKEFLNTDEHLLGIFHCQALSDGGYGIKARYKGGLTSHDYILITNERLIVWARGILTGSTDSFHYSDISSCEEARGLLLGEIVINVRGAKERMRSMVRKDVPIAAKMIRDQIAKQHNQKNKQTPESIPEQIKKLSELKDLGVLTETEFTEKKQILLNKI